MNDTTIGPGPADAGGGRASGNRWEPVATDEPILPTDSPREAPPPAVRSSLGRTRARLAGGAATVLLAGLGGFALGHATVPQGDDAPAYVQQGDHRGLPGHGDGEGGGDGDRGLPEGGPGVPPQGQQGQQGTVEGSDT